MGGPGNDVQAALVELERAFWRAPGDPSGYAAALAGDAVHVLPGLGIVDRQTVLAAVATATPWDEFTLEDVELVQFAAGAAALVYMARAQRAGEQAYAAAITSVYRQNGGHWQLVLHQQTPLSASKTFSHAP